MLTLKLLRESPDFVIRRLAVKNFDAKEIVEKVIALDDKRKALQTESDALLAQQKKAAAAIGQLMKEGKKAEAEAAKAEVSTLKDRSNATSRRPMPPSKNSRTSWSCCPTSPATSFRKERAPRTTWW